MFAEGLWPVMCRWKGERYQGRTGKFYQRGYGKHSLCKECNSFTGARYGAAYSDLVYQLNEVYKKSYLVPCKYKIDVRIHPLRVIKQIVSLNLSLNGSEFRNTHPELSEFVQNENRIGLPDRYKTYIFLNHPLNNSRMSGESIYADLYEKDSMTHISELAFKPMGFLFHLNANENNSLDDRLLDISHFGNYRYDDEVEMTLEIWSLPVINFMPMDYRDELDILKCMAENKSKEELLKELQNQ